MGEQTVFEILHNMDKFTNGLIVKWNKIFKEDLGISHVLMLGYLMTKGQARPSEIAKQLGLTPPTVTHLSEKLVKRQFAIRMQDPNDRRNILLDITDEGRAVLERANKEGHELRSQMFEALTKQEKEQLLHIYKKLNDHKG
ncbi:MAG TPA: MarR family transcriptional regulator [Pseudogracilibacillus sp.]|nr:MarR family transcriptional regulator [Pseudogracilibacillus sp.]